jgi:hypothetical protein
MTDPHSPPHPGDSPPPGKYTQEEESKILDDDEEQNRASKTVHQKPPGAQERPNFAGLQSRKSELEKQHRQTLDAILALRARAREKALSAESTHQPIPQSEVDFWQRGIREKQAELMAVQSELGQLNKALRACRDREQKTNQPAHNGERRRQRDDDEARRILYLECFKQIVEGSVDPRQYKAFAEGAHALMRDFAQMHGGDR